MKQKQKNYVYLLGTGQNSTRLLNCTRGLKFTEPKLHEDTFVLRLIFTRGQNYPKTIFHESKKKQNKKGTKEQKERKIYSPRVRVKGNRVSKSKKRKINNKNYKKR